MEKNQSILSGVVRAFLDGNLAVLMIIMSLIAGAAALWLTPREEEPQIVVPVADVFVNYPGGSAEEVEQLVASRLEKLLFQIDGVEYVYSMSRPGMAVVTVRFHVGQNRENSLIKLYNKLLSNIDQVTPGISGWVVKPVEIDDVPVITAALYSNHYGTHELYRVAEEAVDQLQRIPDSARITIHGGERRVVHVYLQPDKLAAYKISPLEIVQAIKSSNALLESGAYEQHDRMIRVLTGPFLKDSRDVHDLMIGVHEGRPVYLRDVAEVKDGPAELETYSRIGFGPGAENEMTSSPAITIAVAKKTGKNAVQVARQVDRALQDMKGSVIPDDVSIRITRDYGATANEKVNNLVFSLGLAVITVIGLLALSMSWREGIIVAIAVPITYALTLLFNYTMGYTINRVTLFALILTLGLLVDDPIVGVENIHRHLLMKKKDRRKAILDAMNEVMPPIVLSTLAVMVSFFPMFFITGMMGPYMAPMAMNVPIAVLFSTIVALTITPTLSRFILKIPDSEIEAKPLSVQETRTYIWYSRMVKPFIDSRAKSRLLLVIVGALFALSAGLALGPVPLKMLPFDNKNELLLVIDMPESTTLERTDAVARNVEDFLRTVPEVVDFTTMVGGASPMDFNGMVRQYYMRRGPHLADIRINLLHHTRRKMDSHALVLRIRNDLARVAKENNAVIKIVETPPGPPVLASVVAEIYGSSHHTYDDLIQAAKVIRARMETENGMVDIDDSVAAEQRKYVFRVDRDKAALNGISTETIVNTLQLALSGMQVGTIHTESDQNEVPIIARLPRTSRSDIQRLGRTPVKGLGGNVIEIGELGRFEVDIYDQVILHKNLERVVYVESEMAGRGPAYAVLALQKHFAENPLHPGIRVNWRGEGEWKITVDVFRDLGIAFGAALLGIYILLVYQTGSYGIPGVIMLSIPLTMIGIMPGFWFLNVLVNRPVGGFDNPVFFTATAMIGMIALSGIVVRNALVLIEFIRTAVANGETLQNAILESGAVRMRPILLTAGTTLLGAWPITLDPIFSGLAWALIFGLFVSTAFTLVVVPVVYQMMYGGKTELK
ncbi:MAG TPA: efflux RND transporter permease subunit [Kiritimatiellia bacterium]|nr:efflux RND transporter permease subunit [Kiritimatiellia bacterium]